MTNHASANAVTWIAGCLLAGLIGYGLGERQHADHHPGNSSSKQTSLPGRASLLQDDHTVSDIAEEAKHWVVAIETSDLRFPTQKLDAPHFGWEGRRGLASGLILTADGYIATSNHAIGINSAVRVILPDNTPVEAHLVGRDWLTDVAVLKVDATGLRPAHFGDSDRVRAGDWTVAIGCPMHLDQSISLGIVSAVNRNFASGSAPGIDLIQTDAAVNPGNSGGPLLNLRGEVIAMLAAMRTDAQNIAFAVPTRIVREVATELIQQGSIARGYLGVCMSSSATAFDGEHKGVVVIYTEPKSPAAKYGIHDSDLIVAVDGKPVKQPSDLRRALASVKPSTVITLDIVRSGEQVKLKVPLAETPAESTLSTVRHARST